MMIKTKYETSKTQYHILHNIILYYINMLNIKIIRGRETGIPGVGGLRASYIILYESVYI